LRHAGNLCRLVRSEPRRLRRYASASIASVCKQIVDAPHLTGERGVKADVSAELEVLLT
jgi:hypothetical protein